jgi:hypothetical protein
MPTTAHAEQPPAPLAADDFTAWVWADDDDPDALGELHRRTMRDRARRQLDREAAALARGATLHRSALAWAARQLPAGHPHARTVRALAHRAGVTNDLPTGTLGAELRRAARAALSAALCASTAAHTPTAIRAAEHRAAAIMRPPIRATAHRPPRAPSRAGLA